MNNPSLIIAIYVDDGLSISNSKEKSENFMNYLKSKLEVRITDGNSFIGLEVIRNRNNKELMIHQSSYIDKLLEKFKLQDCIVKDIPAAPSVKLSMKGNGEHLPLDTNKPYRPLIGALMYLSTKTRPDISYIVSKLAQFVENPLELHWKAAKRVCMYLKATKNYGICYSGSNDPNKIIAYSDSDFAGDLDDRKSTTGIVTVINGGCVTWSSHRQKCIATSTAEAEYVACSQLAKDVIWLRRLLGNIGIPQNKPTTIYCDNQSAVKLVKSKEMLRRTRHIEVNFHFIREKVEHGETEVEHIHSEKQVADVLTKPLPLLKFEQHRGSMGIMETIRNFENFLKLSGSVGIHAH